MHDVGKQILAFEKVESGSVLVFLLKTDYMKYICEDSQSYR